MVLESAISPSIPSDFASDSSTPSSTPDPYSLNSDSNTRKVTYNVDPNFLSTSYNLRSLITGQPDPQTLAILGQAFSSHAALLQRPLRQSEVDALTEHYSRAAATHGLGRSVGFFTGVALAFRGATTYRFPFHTPKVAANGGSFNPDLFRIPGLPALGGARANLMWHTLRYGLYGLLGSAIGRMSFTFYALGRTFTAEANDERLVEIHARRMELVTEAREQGKAKGVLQREVYKRRVEIGTDNANGSQRPGRGSQASSDDDEDMSPTGGLEYKYTDDEIARLGGRGSGDQMMTDGQLQAQTEQMQQRRMKQRNEVSIASTSGIDSVVKQATSFDDFTTADPDKATMNDDKVPIGTRQASERQPSAGGSAWDRVRQRASSPSTSATSPSTSTSTSTSSWPSTAKDNPSGKASSSKRTWADIRRSGEASQNQGESSSSSRPSEEGFSFSTSDQERQFQKTEAQRVVDERMERERMDKEFGGYGGEGREQQGNRSSWDVKLGPRRNE